MCSGKYYFDKNVHTMVLPLVIHILVYLCQDFGILPKDFFQLNTIDCWSAYI